MLNFWHRFFIDLGCLLALNLASTWAPRWPWSCPRAAREEPLGHLRGLLKPRTAQKPPRTLHPRPPGRCPDLLWASIFIMFDLFLKDLGKISTRDFSLNPRRTRWFFLYKKTNMTAPGSIVHPPTTCSAGGGCTPPLYWWYARWREGGLPR